jgi:type II secretory pathway pseudopilin PulG
MKLSVHSFHRFTLIEVILAIFISGIHLAGLATAFHQSLSLRERAHRISETETRRRFAIATLHTALGNVVLPGGRLTGTFVGSTDEDGERRLDSLSMNILSSAIDSRSLGDILNVEFLLEADEDTGKYRLLRNVTRNLLSLEEEEDPEETELLTDIYGLEITYYDGTDWIDSWDSSTLDDALPEAVQIVISFEAEDDEDASSQAPLELLVPITISKAEETSK